MRIPAAEIEKLVCDRLAVLFDDPVALVGQVHPGAALPECFTQLMAICRNTAGSLRSPDQTTIAGLIGALVRRIEIRHNGIAIMLDRRSIATLLKIDRPADGTPAIEIAVAVKLKRSGFALRLVLPNGNAALRQTDGRLLKTIASRT